MELPGPAPRVIYPHKGPNYTNVCSFKLFPIPALKGEVFDYLYIVFTAYYPHPTSSSAF
jgi:hypothetical protein